MGQFSKNKEVYRKLVTFFAKRASWQRQDRNNQVRRMSAQCCGLLPSDGRKQWITKKTFKVLVGREPVILTQGNHTHSVQSQLVKQGGQKPHVEMLKQSQHQKK